MVGLGPRIRQRRQAAGLTLTELARRAGTAKATLCNIELGRNKMPNALLLYRIATATGVRMEQLLDVPFLAAAKKYQGGEEILP